MGDNWTYTHWIPAKITHNGRVIVHLLGTYTSTDNYLQKLTGIDVDTSTLVPTPSQTQYI